MSYSINYYDGVVAIRDRGELISRCRQTGRLHYQFFQKGDKEWVVFGSEKSYGFRFMCLSDRHMYYYPKNELRYAIHGLLINPTCDYLMFINGIQSIDFMRITTTGTTTCIDMVIQDKKWELYNFLQESSLDKVEWISDFRMIYRCGMYDLIFEMPKDFACRNVTVEWYEASLFDLLRNSIEK